MGSGSPARPKYPAKGFSQMTCFPARMESMIIAPCSAGGVQMSMTSIVLSAMRA